MTAMIKAEYIRRIMIIILIIFAEAVILLLLVNVINRLSHDHSQSVKESQKLQSLINEDMKYFPVPLMYRSEVTYEDSFGAYRNNGGHEGCDIMDIENVPGRIPVISSTDGVVTNIGWLYLGGYRIGITSENDIYYYYAHLDSYAAGLEAGDSVKAGQLLGFMGDTGEGTEGTSGKFPVHLHFGIYVGISEGNEKAVNSYSYLRELE